MLRMDAGGRHAAIVRELELPVPFDLGQFVAGLERQRNRVIQLRPFSSGPGPYTGYGSVPRRPSVSTTR